MPEKAGGVDSRSSATSVRKKQKTIGSRIFSTELQARLVSQFETETLPRELLPVPNLGSVVGKGPTER